jgi:predicted RNase H-like nuclease (RuvC/YqgF family)
MDTEDCLLLIKQILDLTGSNAELKARVESQAKELDKWRAACTSLQSKIGNEANSPHTKAMEMANASIYDLERQVEGHKKTIMQLADELNQLKKRDSVEYEVTSNGIKAL